MSKESVELGLLNALATALHFRRRHSDVFPRVAPHRHEDVLELIAGAYGLPVKIREFGDRDIKSVRGVLLRSRDGAEILVERRRDSGVDDGVGITYCEQRFVMVKEACHLLLDDEPAFFGVSETGNFVDGLIFGFSAGYSTLYSALAPSARSEFLAREVALEFMYPFVARVEREARYRDGTLTALQIAEEFKVPRREVARCMREVELERADLIHRTLDSMYDSPYDEPK